MTYAVMGCPGCQALWLRETGTDQATCPSCGTRHDSGHLRTLSEADDREVAAQQRSALLAARQGHADAALDPYWQQGDRADTPLVEDRAYLEGLGLDEELVAQLTEADTTTEPSESTRPIRSPDPGPDVDVEIADRPQLRGFPADGAAEPGLALLEPGGQTSLTGFEYRNVSPRTSEWLAEVLADVIPSTSRLVQDLAANHPLGPDPHDPEQARGEVPRFVQKVLVEEVAQLDEAEASIGAVEEARAYLEAIGRHALLWSDDVYRVRRGFEGRQQFARIQQTLATTGTSRGQFNAGVDALRHSLAALHAERETPLQLTFFLDGEAWTAADPATLKRALTAFDALAEGFAVRLLMSPGIRQRVRTLVRHARDGDDEASAPGWAQRLASLTEGRDTSRRAAADDAARAPDQQAADAWAWVEGHQSKTGLLTLLAHLDPDDDRSVRAIKTDHEIDVADATIDRYYRILEDDGLVDVDRTRASNRLSLTPLGRAAREFVTRTGDVVHPDQSQLLGQPYRHPPASHKCSVARQQTGAPHHPPAERWMAETGDPRGEGYVQWLGDSTGPRELEPPTLHDRQLAGRRVDGVNLVDSDIIDWSDPNQAPDGDSRVAYTSIFDDQALVVCQWGGPAQTLARLAATLLSNKMLSKALSMDAVGEQFEAVHGGVDAFENDLEDVIQRTQQIGWTSEEELEHYKNWRERIGEVRAALLAKVGELDTLDGGLRSDLFSDLQGLLCSATHMYRAAGIDVAFNIRLPRTKELLANDDTLQDFLDFMRFTTTKQAGYEDDKGFHSIFRMLLEDRPEKLKNRASYDVDPTHPTAEVTASWIITGPEASALKDHIQEAISKESSRVREQIDEGDVDAAQLELPVVEANSHGHIRGLVREIAERKGFYQANRQDLDRLTRCLEAALATADRGPDPCLVADALESLQSRDRAYDQLDTRTIQTALAQLPGEAIFPTLPPSARRMLSALFASDKPLDRQALIEITSENSYDRHWKTLRAFFLVERTDDGYVAHLEPWWAPTSDVSDPFHEANPSGGGFTPPADPRHILLHTVWDTGLLDTPPDRYYELGKPEHDWQWILEELGLLRWQPILAAHCGIVETDSQPYLDSPAVCIGPPSPGTEEQMSLETATVAE